MDATSAAMLRDVLSWYWRMGGIIIATSVSLSLPVSPSHSVEGAHFTAPRTDFPTTFTIMAFKKTV